MSEKALIDTIEVEIKVKLAEGRRCLIAAPGNYGLDFLRDRWGILRGIQSSAATISVRP